MIKRIIDKEMIKELLNYIIKNKENIKGFDIRPERDFFNQIIQTNLKIVFDENQIL